MNIFDDEDLNVRVSEDGERILAEFTPRADFPPFSGHFPGNPILPGIAQIALITEIVNRADASGYVLDTVKRVKFLAPALPEKQLSAEVTCRPDGEKDVVCAEAVLRSGEKKISVLKLLYRRQGA